MKKTDKMSRPGESEENMKTKIKEIIYEEKFHNTNFPEKCYIVRYKSGVCKTYYAMKDFPETIWKFYMESFREIILFNHTYKVLRFYLPIRCK